MCPRRLSLLPRLRTHLLRTAVLPTLLVGVAMGQTARSERDSAGGSLLRLMSGIQGLQRPDEVPPTVADELSPVPDPEMAGDAAGVGPIGLGQVGPHWRWHGAPTPESIVPSLRGPRTPVMYRFQGFGEPLLGASWNNRPFSAGWFAGGIQGGEPIAGHVDYGAGFFGGFRLGWDYDYYFGLETRVGGSAVGIHDLTRPTVNRTGDLVLWDIDLLYYPWGDSRWRPYFSLGLGLTSFQFKSDLDVQFRQALCSMPLGIGLKYRWSDYLVWRIDLMDNLAFGGGALNTMNDLSASLGVEVRFGGVRTAYWPWNPSRHLW